MNRTDRQQKIDEFLKSIDFENCEISYYCENAEVNSFEDVEQAIECANGFDVEIIYYATAMNYLIENDPSLRESLELANNFGYSLKNLNSELLASLLASQNCRDEFYMLKDKIEDFFTELEDEDEE